MFVMPDTLSEHYYQIYRHQKGLILMLQIQRHVCDRYHGWCCDGTSPEYRHCSLPLMDNRKNCLIFKPAMFYHKLPFIIMKMSPQQNAEVLANLISLNRVAYKCVKFGDGVGKHITKKEKEEKKQRTFQQRGPSKMVKLQSLKLFKMVAGASYRGQRLLTFYYVFPPTLFRKGLYRPYVCVVGLQLCRRVFERTVSSPWPLILLSTTPAYPNSLYKLIPRTNHIEGMNLRDSEENDHSF